MRLVVHLKDTPAAIRMDPWVEIRPGVHARKVYLGGYVFEQRKFDCQDCRDVYPEWFVHTNLWKQVMGTTGGGRICMACFERRLGRRVRLEDLERSAGCNEAYYIGAAMPRKMTRREP